MVRYARPEEAEAVWELVREHAEYEQMADEFVGTMESLKRHLFGLRPVGKCLVAVDGDQVVGYALFYANFSTFLARPGLWLEDLYVSPSQRGKGLGKHLLKAVEKAAVEEGCARVDWVVADWNVKAIAFYESMGGELIEHWRLCRISGDQLKA